VPVADTVGSGDAFAAAFLEHYCRTGDPFAAAERGNLLGAYVASRPGAVPEYDEQIRKLLAR
jgi:fructokinase